jgi:hypothetical protein
MSTNQNIGNWSAIVKNDGKSSQINVHGHFPTLGQKPRYHLIKNEPPGINPAELLLTLVFGELADPKGSVYFSVSYTELIQAQEKYDKVLIVDGNGRTIANIRVDSANYESVLVENVAFEPYLEVIKGIEITPNLLKIRVPSGGDTEKGSIKPYINKGFTGLPPYILEVYRVKPDFGKAYLPEGIVLEYTPEELEEAYFTTYRLENGIG